MNVGKLNFLRFPKVGCNVYSIHSCSSVSETTLFVLYNRFTVSVLSLICDIFTCNLNAADYSVITL
jgi:hypothetical protein